MTKYFFSFLFFSFLFFFVLFSFHFGLLPSGRSDSSFLWQINLVNFFKKRIVFGICSILLSERSSDWSLENCKKKEKRKHKRNKGNKKKKERNEGDLKCGLFVCLSNKLLKISQLRMNTSFNPFLSFCLFIASLSKVCFFFLFFVVFFLALFLFFSFCFFCCFLFYLYFVNDWNQALGRKEILFPLNVRCSIFDNWKNFEGIEEIIFSRRKKS